MTPPLAPYRRALETYIDAKDNTRAHRIAEAFAPDAALTISLATSNNVCDAIAVDGGAIDALPWLVVMRERATGALRVGHGVYRWSFDQTPVGTGFHIHIARMDVVPDADGALLDALQEGLSYPWLAPAELHARFTALARSTRALAFVEAFSVPAAAPAASHNGAQFKTPRG